MTATSDFYATLKDHSETDADIRISLLEVPPHSRSTPIPDMIQLATPDI